MMIKPVRKAFFNRLADWIFDGLELSGIHVGSFISGIKMYAYANEHTPERKMILSTYFQMLQAVVIEDTVIYPLTGSAFTVNVFVLPGIPRYTGQRYLWASLAGSFPHGHISCPALQSGRPSLLKVMSSEAFSEDFALPLMSMSAFMSQRSSNS